MKNKEKDILPLGTTFEVVEEAPKAPATAAPRPPMGAPSGPMPLRKGVTNGSIGLMIALAGLLSPYGAPQFQVLAALATAFVVWDLASSGLARVKPTSTSHKPLAPILAILAGGLGLAINDEYTFGMIGGILAVLGGALALAAPILAKGADSKLPPAAPDAAVDTQFSKSFLAYMLVLVSLPLAWADAPGSTGMATYIGTITFLCCILGLWASWAGMWKMWSMPAVTSGILGLVLFLAPLEALLIGILGVARVAMGANAPGMLSSAWPAVGDGHLDFVQYGLPPLLTLLGGGFAGFELLQGAKKGLADNKAKQEAEIAARKAARAVRRGEDPVAAAASTTKPDKKADKKAAKEKRAKLKDKKAQKDNKADKAKK